MGDTFTAAPSNKNQVMLVSVFQAEEIGLNLIRRPFRSFGIGGASYFQHHGGCV